MILIADSGSSKTDWALMENKKLIRQLNSPGMNPFFTTPDEIYQIAVSSFDDLKINNKVTGIYFYGTGCIKEKTSDIIISGLNRFFMNAKILVEDDMIGAARSIFGDTAGIACILGTGSNSCKFNGNEIIEKIPALGYILGDEASGAYFGKTVLNNYFKKQMPIEIERKFKEKFNPDLTEVLNKIYREANPNRYLAGFTIFLSENANHEFIQNLIYEGFEAFLLKNVCKYKEYQSYAVGFAGSVAFYFSDILKNVCQKYKIPKISIIGKPIEGLIKFHQQTE